MIIFSSPIYVQLPPAKNFPMPTVPLKWSENLKHDAKVWAEKLLDSCGKGMWHDPQNSDYGEIVIVADYLRTF